MALASCASGQVVQAGELIVAIDSDMSFPKDVDTVRVEVYAGGPGGPLVYGNDFSIPQEQHLPATLAIVAGTNNTVDIRVLGILGSQLKVVREAVTTVPTDRQATLRMPVAWLCYGEVSTAGGTTGSSCQSGQTCVEGECAPSLVPASTLAVYKPADIFGGASAPGSAGSCFDTVGCFAQGFVPDVNRSTCTMASPTGGVGINLGLVTSAGAGVGICGSDSCYIPLDFSPEGWTVAGNEIQLPQAVCDRLNSGEVLNVVATTTCETKTPSIPTCGAWSSVTSMPGTVDAAAPDGAIPVEMPEAAPEDAAADATAIDSGAGQLLSCPNVWVGIDTSACDPRNPYVGCPSGQACAVVSPTAVGCVPSNTAALDAGSGKQGWPCAAGAGCGDGTYCNSQMICGIYCCSNADCAATGMSGLTCRQFQFAASDGGSGDASAAGLFGVCE
jgi:hypothetical protein